MVTDMEELLEASRGCVALPVDICPQILIKMGKDFQPSQIVAVVTVDLWCHTLLETTCCILLGRLLVDASH